MEFLNFAPNAEFTPGNHILSKDDATPGDAVEHARIKKITWKYIFIFSVG